MVGALSVAAAGGWLVAWNMGKSAGAESLRQEETGSSKAGARAGAKTGAKEGSKSRADRGASPTTFIADGETARLLSGFEAIHAGAVPGKVNEKLIQACRGVLLDANQSRRSRNYSLLLQMMRPEDGSALHEQFLELHREGKTYDEYKTMATRWGEVDAAGALNYLTSQVPLVLPGDDFRAIARGWAHTDPQAALAWIEANPDTAKALNARSAVIEGWMREDQQEALGWLGKNLAKMEPRDFVEATRVAFGIQVNGTSTSVESAADWLNSLPQTPFTEQAAAIAWNSIQWSMGEMPYDKAAAVWAKVGGQEWMGFDQFEGFSGAISGNRTADRGMEGFLSALEKTWPAQEITSQFSRWTTQNPEQTLEWLSRAPMSPVTKAAIRGAVSSLQTNNPAAAAEWAAKLD
ncbi:hypothetical protein GCM10023212_15040 [Luteolibacter yonseiensis]